MCIVYWHACAVLTALESWSEIKDSVCSGLAEYCVFPSVDLPLAQLQEMKQFHLVSPASIRD